ncbi:hypothetical protein [Halomonas sp. PR-M31]|uniref:hypothetical protein n=1 Tax=Halomonas sp. PR-M31 TaxID=1471202 RepID=UPI000A664F4A|nr:hypothetical protein [Halomonas sp. PR-M31]
MLNAKNNFVIGPAPVFEKEGWRNTSLGRDVVLSYSNDSNVIFSQLSDGNAFALFGFAVSVLNEDPVSILSRNSMATIDREAAFLSGRWAAFTSGRCISDASGLMGLFYREVEGCVWISSSPSILGKYIGKETTRIEWDVVHRSGIDWVPAPYTTRKEVYRLLPQRAIEPITGVISAQAPDLETGPDLIQSLTNAMSQCKSNHENTWLSLTAGLDTRVLLAIAKNTGSNFKTYTNKYKKLPKKDFKFPPRIAKLAGFGHEFWVPTDVDAEKRKYELLEASDSFIINGENNGYILGMGENCFSSGDVVLHGAGFEVGRCYYWPKLSSEKPKDAHEILRPLNSAARSDDWYDAINCYIESLDEKLALDMDWRDRFYLDQRIGSFGAAHHFYSDYQGLKRLDIANSFWVMKLLLEYSPESRKTGTAQINVIRQVDPKLLSIPINPENKVANIIKIMTPHAVKIEINKSLKKRGLKF